jgi:phototropin
VAASDGFVHVTGYTRSDIIPRNCRFLQGKDTNREIIQRLKISIDGEQESIELLLNYKKNGEPFWNLVLVGRFIFWSHNLVLNDSGFPNARCSAIV